MKPPIFVRVPSNKEREALEAGLRSSDAFVLRRCQILLASTKSERPPRIAENLGCGSQTVRNAIHEFNGRGLGALSRGSSRPREVHAAFDGETWRRLCESCGTILRGSSAGRRACGRWRTPRWFVLRRRPPRGG